MSVRLGTSARLQISANTPNSSRSRVSTSFAASDEGSIPIHRRLRLSALTHAVAHPQKGPSTTSPSRVLALRMRSSSLSGFCVG